MDDFKPGTDELTIWQNTCKLNAQRTEVDWARGKVELDTEDHMHATSEGPCWHCGMLTPWIQWDFETWLCPGECTDAKWEEYDELQNSLGPWEPF